MRNFKMSKKKSAKKIPGEISLINTELGDNYRGYLHWYYMVGGSETAFGDFKGKVIIKNPKGILFKRLYIDFIEMDGSCVEGKEDHIWIYDKKPFIKAGIQVNDCVSFTGKAYAYRRQDNSVDFSLKDCQRIKKIDPYSLPSNEELKIQSLERIVCETCMYNEHCYGFCIMPDSRKETISMLLKTIS